MSIKPILAQNFTDGMLTFQVTTVSDGGTYAPRHVLAIWIKDGSGNFIKSRKVMAAARKQHLVKWVASSNNNTTDAITGVTLTQHTSHTVSWDCRDLQGNIVPDGTYEVWIEYTSRNSASNGIAGPFYSHAFTKGYDAVQLNIPDQSYFKNMLLSYTPATLGMPENETNNAIPMSVRYGHDKLDIDFELIEGNAAHLAVYDLQGRRLLELVDYHLEAGKHHFFIPRSELPEGIMLIRLWTPSGLHTKKVSW